MAENCAVPEPEALVLTFFLSREPGALVPASTGRPRWRRARASATDKRKVQTASSDRCAMSSALLRIECASLQWHSAC